MRTIFLAGMILLAGCPAAFAWKSSASQTESEIRWLARAIDGYQKEFGVLPPPEQYWIELHTNSFWSSDRPGPPTDHWKRPLLYRVPGKHGDFDLYSVGPDGIDQDGKFDDISNWAGVNDGYHWKATWPWGRLTIRAGIIAGIATLLLRRFLSWRTVLPLAGSVVCLGIFLGGQLLMHPGVVPSRNFPLAFGSVLAFGLFVVGIVFLALHVWANYLRTRTLQRKGSGPFAR